MSEARLRAKLIMKSSCIVLSMMLIASSTTGFRLSMRRMRSCRISAGLLSVMTLAAQAGFTLERIKAAVYGCSFSR